ncbi:putative reverse transcriptase, RNA-dependent DNA polymerase [Tanacetum coccineum]
MLNTVISPLNTVSSPFNTVSSPLNTVSSTVNNVSSSFTTLDPGRAKEQRNEYEKATATTWNNHKCQSYPTTKNSIKDHPKFQIIIDVDLSCCTYNKNASNQNEAGLITFYKNMHKETHHKDFQNCLFACFLSQMEPKKVTQALDDESWVEAMQEELLQFKLLNVWTLGFTSWKEGRRYRLDEVFAPVTRIEAIRLFLAFASYMGFTMYQMDVKSAFLYGTFEEEVYVNQPPGFVDPKFPNRVYKVEKALYGLHQAPRACQDKYVYDILKKFGFSNVKTASTPMETHKPLLQDTAGTDVDVQPKASHMHAVKRIFRYLKGQPTLGLWYPKDSPMDLIAYSDSDYAGASIDRKSTTGGCQFLGCRLISWQCKKQTIVANSTTEAEYIAASNCYGQVGAEAVHKESGDRMKRAATTASSFKTKQNSDAQTRFEAASKSPKIHLSQEVTHLEVGRTLTNKVGSLENELKNTKKIYGTANTKLAKRVKKLEMQVKTGKASRRTKIVLSEDDDVEEDSSKQGRSLIEELDMDADISLVPPHAEIQEKISDETEVLLEEEEATEMIKEVVKKGNKRFLLLTLHLILPMYQLVTRKKLSEFVLSSGMFSI